MKYDVIIIGGGPSGIMAALTSAKKYQNILLVEKNSSLGKKLLLTGGGRCNLTNNKNTNGLIKNIIGNGKFLYSALNNFGSCDIMNFFENLNVELKEEDNGRIFPITNKAKSILDALYQALKNTHIKIQTNTEVIQLNKCQNTIESIGLKNGETLYADNFILATGGKSFSLTGSCGDGHRMATKIGHHITELYSSEVPIISHEAVIKDQSLKGLSFKNVIIKVIDQQNKPLITHQGPMIFTHFGISGPCALRCSGSIAKNIEKDLTLKIDLLPNIPTTQLMAILMKQKNLAINKVLKTYLPERFVNYVAKEWLNIPITNISKNNLATIINKIKAFKLSADATLDIDKAFVTAGGINIKEIDPKTMRSKLFHNLYFCGELIDVHGYTGGYNLTIAFSTGHLAGKLL